MSKTICFDFDGVIHSYTSGWKGNEIIPDPPVEGIKDVLRELYYGYRYDIVILSSRAVTQEGRKAIWDYLCKWDLDTYIRKICTTKPPAIVYVDDRAICFNGNTKDLVEKINNFESWVKKK